MVFLEAPDIEHLIDTHRTIHVEHTGKPLPRVRSGLTHGPRVLLFTLSGQFAQPLHC